MALFYEDNIMVMIPKQNSLTMAMNDDLVQSENRAHVGMSELGNPCYRYLQFVHYWAYSTSHSKRLLRLFNVGHDTEEIMIKDLGQQGKKVTRQQEELTGYAGHFMGHIDGVLVSEKGQDKLIEFKTHNDKSFKDLLKKSVQLSKPVHYVQMQVYMGYMKLNQAMYMAYNKNDSTYYMETVDFDPEFFKQLEEKQEEIIMAETLLPRIGTNSSTWFECKFCDARKTCFGKEEVRTNCRTCKNVHVMDEGKWVCGFTNDELSSDEQIEGCSKHSLSIMFKEVE